MTRIAALLACLLLGVLTGCGTPAGVLKNAEEKYDVGTLPVFDTNLRAYHAALLDPAGIHLDTDGYVIGVEKIDGILGSRRVTHVIEYGGAPGPCIVFSLLTADAEHLLHPEPMATCRPPLQSNDYVGAFRDSLRWRLQHENFSHIFVMVMGWNTDQQEAVKNYNQIINNLRDAAQAGDPGGRPFKPLVIGVSWPSEWALGDWSALPAALVRGASFWAKKDQADDIGRFFLSPIFTNAILKDREAVAPKIPLILIGHSFGARALAAMFPNWKSAYFGKTAWDTSQYQAPDGSAFTFHENDRLFLLEGAFDISELFSDHGQILPNLHKINTTMTSSAVDTAFDVAIWGNYLGDIRTFTKVCGLKPTHIPAGALADFGCDRAVNAGEWGLELCNKNSDPLASEQIRLPHDGRVHYVDASRLINCQTPFGGGGAHDDFYRPEMARFLLHEIRRQPPTEGAPGE